MMNSRLTKVTGKGGLSTLGRRVNSCLWGLLLVLLLPGCAYAADAAANAETYRWWTLLPPLAAIVLAFITKDVVLSLFLGVFSGAVLMQAPVYGFVGGIFQGFLSVVRYILHSLADPWNAGVILHCLAIGGLIGLVTKLGGARAVAEALVRRATSRRSAQVVTWLLGHLVFFDDYANCLIVGPIMRPVTDRLRISRERLSFLIDATAAPVAGIALISTWIGYEIGLIRDSYQVIGQAVNSYGIFVETIPYRFYNLFMLAFVLFTSYYLKEFGPMLKAERRAFKEGKVLSDTATPMIGDDEALAPKEGVKLNVWNAIIPIGVLIVSAFVGFYYNGWTTIMNSGDQELIALLNNNPLSFTALRETFGASDASIVLFEAALLASMVAIGMGVAQKVFTVSEAIETWIQGMKSLLITGVILLLAWSLSSVIKELGTALFLVSVLSDTLPAFLVPTLIFVLGCIIAFATGTSYGTMGILMPLTIPLAAAISPEPGYIVMNVGAVLTGAIFGDHCSPISDTTILASMGAAADHLDHVKTQLPYAIGIGLYTIVAGYIPVGLGLPVWPVLIVSTIFLGLLVKCFGSPVEVEATTSVVEKSAQVAAGR